MVIVAANVDATAPAHCELKLDSGRFIRYVAPKDANPRKEMYIRPNSDEIALQRNIAYDAIDQIVCWEGVNSLCHVLDIMIENEMETDLFESKDVLEIGFATGLPSVYAYENGASEVVLHSPSKSSLDLYCIPTFRRNAIPDNKCKFSSGDLTQMRKAIGGKKFDVILAAELLNRSMGELNTVLEILDEALSYDGVCFLSSPTHYFTVDSNLLNFMELLKKQRKFDVIDRWCSPRTDVVQRKVLQLTRSYC